MKIVDELAKLADKKQAAALSRFFKTGKGEYGEGDIFLGIKVPIQRKVAKKYNLSLAEIDKLLTGKIHEHRLTGLFILIDRYKSADKKEKLEIFNFYLSNTSWINNWDLVDLSSPSIVGNYLLDKDREILYKLAKSKNLWERRIAILATFAFIKNNEFEDALKIAELLLQDKHDLVHKAVGWMLREIGKRDLGVEERFLMKHYKKMPRTMLRYAIEKLNPERRKKYLDGKI